ncbi:MAG: CAP domain-containing protein [Parafilimonas sp.]
MFKVFVLCLLLYPLVSFSQTSIQQTGSEISAADAQALLNHHNKIRNDLGISPLTWSATIAAYAQVWADSLANSNDCNLKHRNNRAIGYGENLFSGSSAEVYKPVDASLAWYSEIKDYTYARLSESNWHKTGHYTQMIWNNTKQVGVGVATCPNGGIVIVANYYPAGNYMGQFPY